MKKRTALVAVFLAACLSGCSADTQEVEESEAVSEALSESESENAADENSGQSEAESVSELISSQYTDSDGSVSQEIFAMDTYMTVKAYGDRASEAVTAAINEIQRLDALLSTGSTDSEITRLNENGGGELTEDTAYLIERALDLYESTEGDFDISIYPMMELWGFTNEKYYVPTEEEITETLQLTDGLQISLDADGNTVSFGISGMEIDLGGIAKGYTSTRITEIFASYGIESGMLNLGGNVQVIGTKTDGTEWNVGIQNPDGTSFLGAVKVSDKAVITSGGYERYFEEDGTTYHHILDPATGYPADSGVISSTIISSDGTLADGLSTSLFIMGVEDACDYWQAHSEEFDFILEDEDGSLYVTEGIRDAFSSELSVTVIEKGS